MKNQSENRKLTRAEEERKAVFDRLNEELAAQGFQRRDLTIDMIRANVMAVVLGLPFALLLPIAFFLKNPVGEVEVSLGLGDLAVFLVIFILLAVVHEGIHGLTWAIFAPGHWGDISFGFIVQYLTPYCTCRAPLSKGAYALGGVMPTVVLGFLPAVIAVFIGQAALLWMGIVMIFAGGADLTILLKLLAFRTKGREAVYVDHPYECGLVAYIRDFE